MNLDGCNAIITGASAGLGREFARLLAGRARSLVLVARRADRLEELAHELSTENPKLIVHTRSVDLADKAQLRDLLRWLNEQVIEIDFLINNAGLGDMGPFASGDQERIEKILLVNMVALTSLTRELLPPMLQKKRGAILNISSSASFMPIAGFAIYAASKAYVTSFSEALRAELHGTGVTVCALCPGPVHTEFTEVAQRPGQPPNLPSAEIVYVAANKVARAGLDGIEADRAIVIPGLVMKLGMAIVRLLPMPLLRLFSSVSAKRFE